MRKHFSDVKTLTGRDQTEKERKLNMMMFSVVIFFIISYSFDNTFFVLWYFNTIDIVYTGRILISFSAVLLTLNSSVNIFFYSYFNENFRKNLVSILSPCKKENLNQNLKLKTMNNKWLMPVLINVKLNNDTVKISILNSTVNKYILWLITY